MNKIIYPKIDLKCVLQKVDNIRENQCLCGIISRNNKGFRFEESIQKSRAALNPKIYDGNYISMVRKRNGKYQFHMKTLSDTFKREELPFAICNEVAEALKMLD